jgi:hypothetical protein
MSENLQQNGKELRWSRKVPTASAAMQAFSESGLRVKR